MRRFSQRNSLVTLSEINITPLLDLAFVLLIIFVITTPLLEQSMDLKLPEGRPARPQVLKQDVRTVEISPQGMSCLERDAHAARSAGARAGGGLPRRIPNLVVYIRADENSRTRELAALIDGCQRNGITRYSLRTEPPGTLMNRLQTEMFLRLGRRACAAGC